MKFSGIIPPVATIFHPDGSLNCQGMGCLIDTLVSSKVHGLFFLGSAGEVAHMDDRLRSSVLRFCMEHTARRLPTLVGVIGCGTAQVMDYAREAEQAGADGIVIINPYYSGLTEKALFHHFKTVAECVRIPSFVYNLPGCTGQDLSVELILRLALEVPSIVGVKDTTEVLAHVRAVLMAVKARRPDFAVLCGYDEHLLPTLLLGGDGCVPASANFAPHLTCGIYDAYHAQQWERAQALHRTLAHVAPLYQMGPPFYGAMKEAIRLSGVDITPHVLLPALPATQEEQQEVRGILHAVGCVCSQGE